MSPDQVDRYVPLVSLTPIRGILLVSQETSTVWCKKLSVPEHWGYVAKPSTGIELLAAVEAVGR
jgi:hypothetical protein